MCYIIYYFNLNTLSWNLYSLSSIIKLGIYSYKYDLFDSNILLVVSFKDDLVVPTHLPNLASLIFVDLLLGYELFC